MEQPAPAVREQEAPAVVPQEAVAGVDQVVTDVLEVSNAEPQGDAVQALLAPADAVAWLWSLYSDEAPPPDTCPASVQSGIACIEGNAQTWEQLAALDRAWCVLEQVKWVAN